MEISTGEKVRDQLARVLLSHQLSGSSVLSEFLNYIVHETLEGRGNELKEYTIGVHALHKDADFNPQLDSIVRIHAGRLRRALKEYYYEEGAHDPMVIIIPKGSYVPVFETRSADSPLYVQESDASEKAKERRSSTVKEFIQKAPALPRVSELGNRPAVAVLPFKKIGSGEAVDYLVKGMGEFLCTELTRFDNLKIISNYSADYVVSWPGDIRKIGAMLDADYILTGSVHELGVFLRICVQLNFCQSGDQLWAQTFEKTDPAESVWVFQTKVVDATLAAIAGMNGVISRLEMRKSEGISASFTNSSSLAYWYNRYIDSFNPEVTKEARTFYENVIKEDPRNPLALSYLSNILSGEMSFPECTSSTENLATHYAQTALKLDPQCQQAYFALALNMLLQRRNEECIRTLEQGLEINPKSTEYRSAMAALMIYAGNYEDGVNILDKVIKLNPHLPWWQTMSYSYYSYYREFYADALFWAERIKVNVVWTPIIRTAAYAQLDQMDKAHEMLTEFKTLYPTVALHEREVLKRYFHTDDLVNKLEVGLAKLVG
ncbi:MAG TPA: tetratricopeptide repeat protein [Ohtaekwangia sp.]